VADNGRAAALADVQGLPDYDKSVVDRVAAAVTITSLDLVEGYFGGASVQPLPGEAETELPVLPQFGLEADWDSDETRVGCVLTFATVSNGSDLPSYSFMARFRAVYQIREGRSVVDEDLEQFVYWRALFDVWPYWREYHAATLTRSGGASVVTPLLPSPER
jgi:hypothetical protein